MAVDDETTEQPACGRCGKAPPRGAPPLDSPVEIRPGLPETGREVALAFGPNLQRLGALKRRWDPTNTFRHSYPL